MAESFDCTLADGRALRFTIDPSMFSQAISQDEPIRRRVTQVEFGAARFPAEPFRIGAMRGFSAESLGAGTLIAIVDQDRKLRLSNHQEGISHSGICEVIQ